MVFALLGTLMFCAKTVMAVLPNIHPLGMFVMVCTLVFRAKALIPIYLYVMLDGLLWGFSPWWIPYLYVWIVLWGMTMLLPKTMSRKTKKIVYPAVCALHGFLFGILYAPAQVVMFGMDLKQTLLWILAGIPFDLLHGFGDLCMGLLVLPLSEFLAKLMKRQGR